MINQFNTDGFLIVKNCLESKKILSTLDEFNQIIINRLETLNINSKTELWDNLKNLFDHDISEYLNALTLLPKTCSVQKLFLDDSIFQTVNELGVKGGLFQTSPVFHIMAENLKIPNGYFGFGAHQDWTSLQSSLNNITVWIPLVDVDETNFTLEVAPGSHLEGLVKGKQLQNYYLPDEDIVKKYQFKPIRARAGDVVFMSNFLLHKSSTEGDINKIRLALSHRYEDFMEETFIKRAYPYTQKKVVERVEITDEFPTKEQVLEVYKNG